MKYSKRSLRKLIKESIHNILEKNTKRAYAKEVWDSLEISYNDIGGYKSHLDIEDMIEHSAIWKVDIVDGKLKCAIIYKGKISGLRKIVGIATDKTLLGKEKLINLLKSDFERRSVFVEASGPLKKYLEKHFQMYNLKSSESMSFLPTKDIELIDSDEHDYFRYIRGVKMRKTIFASKLNISYP